MENCDRLFLNRLSELSSRALFSGRYEYSEFLTLFEQNLVKRAARDGSAPLSLLGGYDGAERRIALFGDEELCGYPPCPPIVCMKIAPISQRFAQTLTHRDFLGGLLSLGLRRSVIGDIIIEDNCGYAFCLEAVSGFIEKELNEVKGTRVKSVLSPPPAAAALPDKSYVNIASERLDAVIAAVYHLPRSESQRLFEQEKVFINGKAATSQSAPPHEGEIVSVRGVGRFIYEGIEKETRKGRLRVVVRIY